MYVSLCAACFADPIAANQTDAVEWRSTYDAALEAGKRESFDEAIALLIKSWNTAQIDRQRGATAAGLALIYRHTGHPKDAELWYARARKAWTTPPYDGYQFAIATVNLGDLRRSAGDYDGAEQIYRDGLAAPACDSPYKSIILNSLADLLRETGRITEAQALYQQIVDDKNAAPVLRANGFIGLADIDRQNQSWDSSVTRWNQALDLTRKAQDVMGEAIELRGLALTWLDAGSPARAEPLLRRSLQLMENDSRSVPEQLAMAHSGLGQLYRSENKLTLAEEEWTKALELEREVVGEHHPQIAWLYEMLAEVYSARGEKEVAADYATRASDLMASSFGEDSMPLAAALSNRALVEERASHFDAAMKDYERAIAIAAAHPENRRVHIVIMQRYASLLKNLHRGREAKALALQVRAFRAE
jgi:tetratricopeptide (TPR) repeat protein